MDTIFASLSTIVDASIARRIAASTWPDTETKKFIHQIIGADLRDLGILSTIKIYSGWDILQAGMELDPRLRNLMAVATASQLVSSLAENLEIYERNKLRACLPSLISLALEEALTPTSIQDVALLEVLIISVGNSIHREVRIANSLTAHLATTTKSKEVGAYRHPQKKNKRQVFSEPRCGPPN